MLFPSKSLYYIYSTKRGGEVIQELIAGRASKSQAWFCSRLPFAAAEYRYPLDWHLYLHLCPGKQSSTFKEATRQGRRRQSVRQVLRQRWLGRQLSKARQAGSQHKQARPSNSCSSRLKIRISCEIADFVETHICKMSVTLRSISYLSRNIASPRPRRMNGKKLLTRTAKLEIDNQYYTRVEKKRDVQPYFGHVDLMIFVFIPR